MGTHMKMLDTGVCAVPGLEICRQVGLVLSWSAD